MPEEFLQYISAQRRYSPRTCAVYREALEAFYRYAYPLDNAPEAGARRRAPSRLRCPRSSR